MKYRDTFEDATSDHDKNLCAFLQCRESKGLKLNIKKLQLRQTELPFIRHVATGDKLLVDPTKIKMICNMPALMDKAGHSDYSV